MVPMRTSQICPCHWIRKLDRVPRLQTSPGEMVTSASAYPKPRQQLCNGTNKTPYSWGTGLLADKDFFLWMLFEVFHLKFALEVPSPDWPCQGTAWSFNNLSKQSHSQSLEFCAIIIIISKTFKKCFLLSTSLHATMTFRVRHSIQALTLGFTHCCRLATCKTSSSVLLRF